MYPLSLSRREGLERTPCSSSGGSAVLPSAMGDCGDEAIAGSDAGECSAVVGEGEAGASATDARCDSEDFLHAGLTLFPVVIDSDGPDAPSYRSGSMYLPRSVYPSARE